MERSNDSKALTHGIFLLSAGFLVRACMTAQETGLQTGDSAQAAGAYMAYAMLLFVGYFLSLTTPASRRTLCSLLWLGAVMIGRLTMPIIGFVLLGIVYAVRRTALKEERTNQEALSAERESERQASRPKTSPRERHLPAKTTAASERQQVKRSERALGGKSSQPRPFWEPPDPKPPE